MKARPDTTSTSSSSYNTTASGNAAVITLAAASGNYHVVDSVTWSYSDDPTAGALTIADSGTLFSVDITSGGPGQLGFGPNGLIGASGSAVTITLADGSQTKKLTVQYR